MIGMASNFIPAMFTPPLVIAPLFVAPIFVPAFLYRKLPGILAVVIARFGRRAAEIGQDRLLLHLALAQRCQIVGDSLFFVEADLAGIGAHEAFIEDSARELVEMLVLQRAQHAGTDLGGIGDGVELDAAFLAPLAKFFSERSQRLAPAEGKLSLRIVDGTNDRRRWGQMSQAGARSTLPRI